MNEHSELPFMKPADMPGMPPGIPPFMMMALWPWLLANAMVANTMSFWTMTARGGLGKSWPLGDSFDHVGDAPAEELMPHEEAPAGKFKPKAKH